MQNAYRANAYNTDFNNQIMAPTPDRPVEQQMMLLNTEIEETSRELEELVQRLRNVLRPTGTGVGKESSAPVPVMSPMRSALADRVAGVQRLRACVNDVLDRLEV